MKKSKLNIDVFWQKSVIKLLPKWVSPNLLSVIRLLFLPLIFWLVISEQYPLALILFILSALTDSLDGALARQRGQITPLGLIIDPLADKLLIIGIAIIFLFRYPFPELLGYLIAFELVIVVIGYIWMKDPKRQIFPSNIWGKLKMACQSLGLVLIFVWLMTLSQIWLFLSAIFLLFALSFLIISAIVLLKYNNNI
jgi:CDP-diacylglycerol--glycerol-3-phosphate 3-phosphatidyltransferase